jgi:RimJ/RimL family protein N-acetyltransferase
MRLLPFTGTGLDDVRGVEAAPGWPHADTAAALQFAATGAPCWLIVDDDGRVAGECGAKTPPAEGAVEIGYGLAGPSRGRGLGTAAVRALIEELRTSYGVRCVVAEVRPGNVASRRLLERLGFGVDGYDGGYVRYRLVVPPTTL